MHFYGMIFGMENVIILNMQHLLEKYRGKKGKQGEVWGILWFCEQWAPLPFVVHSQASLTPRNLASVRRSSIPGSRMSDPNWFLLFLSGPYPVGLENKKGVKADVGAAQIHQQVRPCHSCRLSPLLPPALMPVHPTDSKAPSWEGLRTPDPGQVSFQVKHRGPRPLESGVSPCTPQMGIHWLGTSEVQDSLHFLGILVDYYWKVQYVT